MKYDTQSGRHSVYSLQYHLIFCTKYRKSLITPEVSDAFKEYVEDAISESDVEILNKETDDDHVHLLFRATSTTDLSQVVNKIKGATSRRLRNQFPGLKQVDSLWSPAYFIASTGEVTLDQLKEYVDEHADEGN